MAPPSHPHVAPRAVAALVLLLAASGCGAGGAEFLVPGLPTADLARFTTRETVDGVVVSVTVTPTVAQPGDTVQLVAVARNLTRSSIRIGVQCGPAMDVLLVTPERQVRSALADVTNGAYFTCELTSRSFVEPDSSRVVRLAWIAPAVRGRYSAIAGLRRSDGLGNASAAARFTVR